ncbi:glucoamylase family protein [Schlesneria paludicola]|uniref:glucoamylase family protein n=1 Tax=Schlesneria paludicola TaxID=360056 RepID=UPI00029A1A68|nr:glucoamylase family protein [Schlesneria paludicola]
MSRQRTVVASELDELQCDAFRYILHETNPKNGLVVDRTSPNWHASIAAVGMALTAYPVAVERGFITREAAIERTLTTLRFFWNSHQGPEPDATGHRGFYYHFLDMQTGRRAVKSELSTVDTAILMAGILVAALYFSAKTPSEQEIGQLAEKLYERVDWRWAQNRGATVTHGWKPKSGFLKFRWEGYDEALLLYVLGLGSPTHPLTDDCYTAWASSYEWASHYGIEYLSAGPLFIHQMSHLWIDFRKIQDAFMRGKGIDYFENSRRATLVQQKYAIDNPLKFEEYGEHCWGITASDGPGPGTKKINGIERKFFDYKARGVPNGPDDGTLAPWAVVASLPFAPEIVLPAIDFLIHDVELKHTGPYGFKASYNPTHPAIRADQPFWISPWHYGIDQVPIVLMIENYRSNLIWQLTRHCPYIVNGLRKAGFQGGWM